MKKTIKQKTVITLASLGLACSSVVVFANTAKATKSTGSTTQSSLTVDQAKEKALNESKSGQVIGYEQEAKFGKTVFEITILDGQNEKEYKIDGQTGDVLKSKTKDLTKDKDDKQLINASYKIDLAGAEIQLFQFALSALLSVRQRLPLSEFFYLLFQANVPPALLIYFGCFLEKIKQIRYNPADKC